MENKDYTVEILEIIRSNISPGIMRSRLEDYHANDLAEVFPQLKISERRKICRILDLDMLSDIFEHIDEQAAAEYLDDVRVFDNLPGFFLILFGNVENIHTLSFIVGLQK